MIRSERYDNYFLVNLISCCINWKAAPMTGPPSRSFADCSIGSSTRITITGMKFLKSMATCGVILALFSMVALLAQGKSATETRARDVWTDPATGLMWVARDNGKDVSWKGAVKYCRDLRLAGYSNWRLATRAELGGIYDRNANAPGSAGKDNSFTYHVKGNLFLTGDEWSSERINDDRGHPSAYAWYFDFNEGRSADDPSGFPYPHSLMRALCVRGAER